MEASVEENRFPRYIERTKKKKKKKREKFADRMTRKLQSLCFGIRR